MFNKKTKQSPQAKHASILTVVVQHSITVWHLVELVILRMCSCEVLAHFWRRSSRSSGLQDGGGHVSSCCASGASHGVSAGVKVRRWCRMRQHLLTRAVVNTAAECILMSCGASACDGSLHNFISATCDSQKLREPCVAFISEWQTSGEGLSEDDKWLLLLQDLQVLQWYKQFPLALKYFFSISIYMYIQKTKPTFSSLHITYIWLLDTGSGFCTLSKHYHYY